MANENWKKGDIAICVNNGLIVQTDYNIPPLILNYQYTVKNTYTCPNCQTVALDVGIGSEVHTTCNCEEDIPMKNVHWCFAGRFVKKQKLEQELEEAVSQENYERAHEIKNIIDGTKN